MGVRGDGRRGEWKGFLGLSKSFRVVWWLCEERTGPEGAGASAERERERERDRETERQRQRENTLHGRLGRKE